MAFVVGLTGGIGSGKSTVCALLEKRGAVIIDADAIVHELQEPGMPVFNEMIEAFGDAIVGADGRLDRPKVASIVFEDEEKRRQLQDLVWPAVGREVLARIASAGDGIVVVDIPLLTENTREERGLQKIVVVDVTPETQLERAVARGAQAEDVRKRIAAQATRDDRLALADHVIDNEGSPEALEKQVDELWAELMEASKP